VRTHGSSASLHRDPSPRRHLSTSLLLVHPLLKPEVHFFLRNALLHCLWDYWSNLEGTHFAHVNCLFVSPAKFHQSGPHFVPLPQSGWSPTVSCDFVLFLNDLCDFEVEFLSLNFWQKMVDDQWFPQSFPDEIRVVHFHSVTILGGAATPLSNRLPQYSR
jgi:hypothetical protein